MSAQLKFPEGFLWGAATSSYQIEGAHDADGKGESIWDTFCRRQGVIRDGDTGDVACDHYNRWPEDVAMMRQLGLNTYRLSLSWPRILPEGTGKVNAKGLDFYRRLLDALLEAGITPSVTLYHWDLPQALQDSGGWTQRATAQAMADYADVVTRELGSGREGMKWTTHNEPAISSLLGHLLGVMAPGTADPAAALSASHHILLSHGLCMQAIRANCPHSEAGIVLNVQETLPTDAGTEAYQRYRRLDGLMHRWFLDPVFGRGYPQDMLQEWRLTGGVSRQATEVIRDGDEAIIGAPIDCIGINYYMRHYAEQGDAGAPFGMGLPRVSEEVEHTEMGWEVYPEGLFNVLCRIQFDYRPKAIYITENGCSYSDAPDAGGRIRDERRRSYVARHLAQVHRAIQAGVPVKGYYLWSLMDNFEWAHGYAQRFGIVWVDFQTQQRILKDSALWYKQVIAANGL